MMYKILEMRRLAVALATVGALCAMTVGGPAEARRGDRGGSGYVEWNFKTPGPVHGYSGHAGAGSSAFCDYQRLPERKCTYTADGRSKCKVVGWTLKQYCY